MPATKEMMSKKAART